jgi:hypothetical protein
MDLLRLVSFDDSFKAIAMAPTSAILGLQTRYRHYQ